ncbi:DUF1803 domain-containing protein [Enterococcus sp. DIV0660C]|uniref:DUF1803 domain-containing protein n=1 Tax=Enterococcus sp. DIV0660C TaxID=2230880 RepID=UPI001A90C119|nr:DUF1803 domain-containing protein [Enterococcus sp. DIV0660C]MBO0432227.1 DUF1803 domain-containing protein [Enterococcus sp. DIV0660C]
MNYFYSPKNKVYQKLVADPLFSPVITYLSEQPEPVILRELKQVFPQRKFEYFLDQLIEAGLVKREQRRYELSFPIFTENEANYQEIIASQAQRLSEQLSKLSKDEQQFILGETLWSICFEEDSKVFYGYKGETEETTRKTIAGNEAYQFVSISTTKNFPVTIANYFFVQKNKPTQFPNFSSLATLLGDVNEVYYFDQVEVIIERIRLNKFKNRRPNIFLESLIQTKTIQSEPAFELLLPVLENKKELSDVQLTEIVGLTESEVAFVHRKMYEEVKQSLGLTAYSYIKAK